VLRRGSKPGVAISVLLASPAHADHEHHAIASAADAPPFAASLSLLAAAFDTMFYGGDYQGVIPGLDWSRGRFGAGTSVPLYQMTVNGREVRGPGDVDVHGQVALVEGTTRAGLALAVMLPTGDHVAGLGMGHPMLVPATWVQRGFDRVVLSASLGYGVALGGGAHHDHGAWPLVDPMARSEVTLATAGDVRVPHGVHVGARLSGAIPVGVSGDPRVIAAARAVWIRGRVQSGLELQGGVVGDPFTLRGVVQTTLGF
jgi:hypothetical protein